MGRIPSKDPAKGHRKARELRKQRAAGRSAEDRRVKRSCALHSRPQNQKKDPGLGETSPGPKVGRKEIKWKIREVFRREILREEERVCGLRNELPRLSCLCSVCCWIDKATGMPEGQQGAPALVSGHPGPSRARDRGQGEPRAQHRLPRFVQSGQIWNVAQKSEKTLRATSYRPQSSVESGQVRSSWRPSFCHASGRCPQPFSAS